jgi:hypothetical protein
VLYRNGELTHPDERTLFVAVSGIEVPPPGITVTLDIETQHRDPDLGGIEGTRFSVLHTSKWISNTEDIPQKDVTVTFVHEFNAWVLSDKKSIPTPTDYFRYDILVMGDDHTNVSLLYTFSAEYAFLMENQWIAQLPEVSEETVGAAPDEMIVYYCDMFPFQNDTRDRSTWISRLVVRDYVESELGPAMVEAIRVQTNEWGFVWSQEWTSYRSGGDAGRLSVALTDGQTWFHGSAPAMGNAGISIKVKAGGYLTRAGYDNLTDKLMRIFQHELFHNLQRNIELHYGGTGDLDGLAGAWRFFSEGTAVLASTVGQPDIRFIQGNKSLYIMFNADNFLVEDINQLYAVSNPNHAALYWRFLYEQCGGVKNGVENPSAGMHIIKRTLNILYSKEIIDIHTSSDILTGLPAVMDQSLAGSTCPFNTYEESLAAFTSAINLIRSGKGR